MLEASQKNLPGIVMDRIGIAFNHKPILHVVSFVAPRGKTTVLFGPSGAGKTTCLRIIAGFELPSNGTVTIGDSLVSSPKIWVPPRQRGIGFCFQDAALWPALSVRKHLEVPIQINRLDSKQQKERIEELLDIFGLTPLADRLPSQLSGGEKKRLAFARAIVNRPPFLLLDEPLSSVEGPLREHLSHLLEECRRYQSAVVVVTHQLEEVFSLADHLVILTEGRVLRAGNPEEVIRDPKSRIAAELLGYRNFFSVTVQDRELITPFGRYLGNWPTQGKNLAACLPEDLIAVPDEESWGQVVSFRYFGRLFRVQVFWENQRYEAVADIPLNAGQKVNLRLNHSPILIPI